MVSFAIKQKAERARAATLTTTHATIQTPAVLLQTKDGNPPYMTPGIMETMENNKRNNIIFEKRDFDIVKDILADIKEAHGMHVSISDVYVYIILISLFVIYSYLLNNVVLN